MGNCASVSVDTPVQNHIKATKIEVKRAESFQKTLSRQSSFQGEQVTDLEKYKGIKPGLKLLCLDSFVSKYTGETMYKWRAAEVRIYDGSKKTSKMLVHYESWSEKYDKWIDLNSDEIDQICPLGIISPQQEESGVALNTNQQKAAKLFFETGKQMEHQPEITKLTPLSLPDTQIHETDEDAPNHARLFRKGSKIDVQDVFQRLGEVSPSSKWRTAEVLELSGSKLRVHYIGWDHEYDEVIDLKKDKHRVRKAGALNNALNGARNSGRLSEGNRQLRRSFDSTSSIPTDLDDGPQYQITHHMQNLKQSLSESRAVTTPESSPTEESTARPEEEEDASPALLLRNKVAPINRRRNVSFTTKSGQVVSGNAAGVHHHGLHRRHSGSGMETGRRISAELAFADRMENIGLHIVEVEADGNCLFRALSHQLYCTEDRHAELRQRCVKHMLQYRHRFEIFCTADFDSYCKSMAMDGTWASELEIRALEEITDRIFSIYSSETKAVKPMPMATNFDEALLLGLNVDAVKLSYHGNHYNSLFDQSKAFPLGERKSSTLVNARDALAGDSVGKQTMSGRNEQS